MNYTRREVVRRLKQYAMFLNSLNLTTDTVQKERICDQLDKIERQILLDTNSEYEEEYMLLLDQNTNFFDEEKTRLRNLISLVASRREYLNERKVNHKKITGSLVELTTFIGEDKLSDFKKRLEIIEKYEKNKSQQEILIRDIKSLDVKISEASRNVKANNRLNDSLESKMINLVGSALKKLNLFSLIDKKDDLKTKVTSLEFALNLAKDNLKSAKENENSDMVLECDNLLSEITIEYSKYNEELNILSLINIYDNQVLDYDELLSKREKINEIIKNITSSNLSLMINEELGKQLNTIRLEKQDIKTLESLKEERENKNKELYDIEEENNSKEFKLVLEELIKNEVRAREEQIKKARQEEYQKRQKKLLEEQKIEAERVKRQKLIEETKLKDQIKNAEKIKELQENTVIAPFKNEDVLEKNTIINDDFNNKELFENNNIIPNKTTIEEDIMTPFQESEKKDTVPFDLTSEVNILDLFKEESKKQPLEIEEETIPTSVTDVLRNKEKSAIWKETNNSSIPVIGNNHLKPEIIEKVTLDEMSFPKIEKKEGEILWKETI